VVFKLKGEMSPLTIEARGEISFKLPDGETVKLKKGKTLSLPEVPGQVMVEAKEPSFSITKETFPNPNVSRRVDAIRIQGEAEGWILPQKGERQSLQKLYFCSAGDLEKNPITVLTEKGEIVKIFWEEE